MKTKSSADNKRTISLNEWTDHDCPRRADIVPWREMNDQGLILDIHSGDYFEINETALLIWKNLDGTHSVGNIASQISKTYSIPLSEAMSDLKQFLTSMKKAKLILT